MLIMQTAWEYINQHPQLCLLALATIYSVLGGLLSLSVLMRPAITGHQLETALVISHEGHLPIPSHFDYNTVHQTWNRLFKRMAQFCGLMAAGSVFVAYYYF